MNIRALLTATAASLLAAVGVAAPPLAGSWNITPSGSAASSGELLFRVTPGGGDPVEITVPVRNGADEVAVARNIRQALSSQLRRDRYAVQLGEGANVLVSDPRGKPSFSVELLDSDVDALRVSVRNIEPAAGPTVPAQATPANSPPPATPPQPGASTPPTQIPSEAMPPANTPQPTESVPPTDASSPMAPPPNSTHHRRNRHLRPTGRRVHRPPTLHRRARHRRRANYFARTDARAGRALRDKIRPQPDPGVSRPVKTIT